jgi:hypothetical protein
MTKKKKANTPVYFAVYSEDDEPLYGYKSIKEEAIPDSRRHLWASYPFVLKVKGQYYYKIKCVGYGIIIEDDFALISRKTEETDTSPAFWELYGLKPIFQNGVCLDRCTVLRKLHYTFSEPTKLDFLAYVDPVELDTEPDI